MSLHKVRIDNVYVKDFYHNPINTISVCINGTLVDREGQERLSHTDGKVDLEYDSSNFRFPEGSDVVEEMNKLKDAFLTHVGRVVNLECSG